MVEEALHVDDVGARFVLLSLREFQSAEQCWEEGRKDRAFNFSTEDFRCGGGETTLIFTLGKQPLTHLSETWFVAGLSTRR